MITELVSDDNNSYKLPLIKLVETKNMMVLRREEKERLVLDLYNQGRTYREIAKEARISPRDIGHILRKAKQNNQRQQQEDSATNNGRAAEPLDKTTRAYQLFSEGKKPIEVVVDLGLNGEETIRLYKEFWKLKHLNELYQIYPEIKHTLPSFLKLHKSLKRQGMGPKNVEWFVDILKSAAYDIPALEVQIEYVKSELEDIQHKKNKSINEVDELNDRIAYLQSSEQSLSEPCSRLRENIEYLENEQERLETFTEMYKRTDKKYCKIIKIAQGHIDSFLTDKRALIGAAVLATIEALRMYPNKHSMICGNDGKDYRDSDDISDEVLAVLSHDDKRTKFEMTSSMK